MKDPDKKTNWVGDPVKGQVPAMRNPPPPPPKDNSNTNTSSDD